MSPAWDASGKYLWFLASTDFGLRSQWLDMTSYDRDENFGLYLAVLKKGEPSPLLPESDEDTGVTAPAPAGAGGRGSAAARPARAGGRRRRRRNRPAGAKPAPQAPVTVHIDFDGMQQRIIAVPGVPERQYAQLQAGAAGTVFYLEAAGRRRGPGGGSTLQRYRLSDRKAAPFATGVADYAVSADGRKLLYRARGRRRRGAGGGAGGTRRRRACSWSMPTAPARRRPGPRSRPRSACISIRRRSSGRSSTRAGATSATTSTCRTCTAPTGRR